MVGLSQKCAPTTDIIMRFLLKCSEITTEATIF